MCRFVGCRFVGCRFVGCRFVGCRFVGCRFVGCRLGQVRLCLFLFGLVKYTTPWGISEVPPLLVTKRKHAGRGPQAAGASARWQPLIGVAAGGSAGAARWRGARMRRRAHSG